MVQKNIVNLFFWLLFFSSCFLLPPDKTKKVKISPERFSAWAVNNRIDALINFAIDSQVVYCAKTHSRTTNPDVGGFRYRDCACSFPAVTYREQKVNIYELIQAYQDSQIVHKDTFLHHCENTEAINQALINANIETAEYSKAEIAAILKKWGEPSNQTVTIGLADIDTLLLNFKDTSLNRYRGDLRVRTNVFVSNYDSVFTHLQNIVLRLNCREFLYSYATEKDSALNIEICEQLRLNMQPIDTNFILIADYHIIPNSTTQQNCIHCGGFTNEHKKQLQCLSKADYCLPAFIYRFEIYDKNGFVQVKKKILNGYNLFLR